jgi:hypothetical protein
MKKRAKRPRNEGVLAFVLAATRHQATYARDLASQTLSKLSWQKSSWGAVFCWVENRRFPYKEEKRTKEYV